MTTTALFDILHALGNRTDPRTGEQFAPADTCLADAGVQRALDQLTRTVVRLSPDIPDALIMAACADLRALDYRPTVDQLAKILIGSRSIADRNLKGLAVYNRYRGVLTRPRIHTILTDFSRRFPELLYEIAPPRAAAAADRPWREVTFFRDPAFNQLEPAKEAELTAAVSALPVGKDTARLPDYMRTARLRYPRAFEPWGHAEHALLVEAMCYTNDLAVLERVFGRSARSVEGAGQRLIYESQSKHRA